jgi:hypothetical protein
MLKHIKFISLSTIEKSKSSIFIVSIVPPFKIPAQFTKMLILPYFLIDSSTIRSQIPGWQMSPIIFKILKISYAIIYAILNIEQEKKK